MDVFKAAGLSITAAFVSPHTDYDYQILLFDTAIKTLVHSRYKNAKVAAARATIIQAAMKFDDTDVNNFMNAVLTVTHPGWSTAMRTNFITIMFNSLRISQRTMAEIRGLNDRLDDLVELARGITKYAAKTAAPPTSIALQVLAEKIQTQRRKCEKLRIDAFNAMDVPRHTTAAGKLAAEHITEMTKLRVMEQEYNALHEQKHPKTSKTKTPAGFNAAHASPLATKKTTSGRKVRIARR